MAERGPTAAAARAAALRAAGLLDTPPEEAFDRLTRLAHRATGAPVALISLVDGEADRQFLKSGVGLAEPLASRRQTPLSHSFCRHVVEDDAPLAVEDASAHPRVSGNPAVRDLGVAAYLGVPLRDPDGTAIGALCAIDGRARAWRGRTWRRCRTSLGSPRPNSPRAMGRRRWRRRARPTPGSGGASSGSWSGAGARSRRWSPRWWTGSSSSTRVGPCGPSTRPRSGSSATRRPRCWGGTCPR